MAAITAINAIDEMNHLEKFLRDEDRKVVCIDNPVYYQGIPLAQTKYLQETINSIGDVELQAKYAEIVGMLINELNRYVCINYVLHLYILAFKQYNYKNQMHMTQQEDEKKSINQSLIFTKMQSQHIISLFQTFIGNNAIDIDVFNSQYPILKMKELAECDKGSLLELISETDLDVIRSIETLIDEFQPHCIMQINNAKDAINTDIPINAMTVFHDLLTRQIIVSSNFIDMLNKVVCSNIEKLLAINNDSVSGFCALLFCKFLELKEIRSITLRKNITDYKAASLAKLQQIS